MKSPLTLVFCSLLVLVITACSASLTSPDIKHNPNPKMRYEIILTIKDAPGPFDLVQGYMGYQITNEQCAPFERFAGIYRVPPDQHLPFTFERVANNEYRGVAYLDMLLDEDYYGLGVCHWKMRAIGVQLHAGKMAFNPYMFTDQIASQKPLTQYFYKRDYGIDASSAGGPGIVGQPYTSYLEKHPDKRFEITMIAKESFE